MKPEHLPRLFLFVLLAGNFEQVLSQKGPTLNVPSEWIHFSSEFSIVPLKITCFGNRTLSWKTKVQSVYYNVTENNVSTGYSSTFMIADPDPFDTGYFTCIDESGESVSTYVYVFDNNTGFVNYADEGTVRAIKVKVDEPIRIDCRTTHPNITVHVLKNIKEVRQSQMQFNSKTGVHLKRSQTDDIGTVFRCKNDFNVQETNIFTVDTIYATPKIEFISVPDVFSSEESIKLKAKVVSFDVVRNQSCEPTVTWYFNNRCPKGIDSCGVPTKELQLNSTITYNDSSKWFKAELRFNTNSSGVIEARIRNKFGENHTSTHVILSDIGKKFGFNVEIESENLEVNKSMQRDIVEGDRLTLTCAAVNFVYENLKFQKLTDKDFIYDKSNSSLSTRYYFATAAASIDMSGNYTCSAKTKSKMTGGRIDSVLLSIRVLEGRSPTILLNSNLTLQDKEVTVEELKPFNISCFVDGLPKPTITWFKDGVEMDNATLENDQMITLKEDTQVLVFKATQKAHEGIYKCIAENRAGWVEHSVVIQINKISLIPQQWILIILVIVCIAALCYSVGYLTLKNNWCKIMFRNCCFRRS